MVGMVGMACHDHLEEESYLRVQVQEPQACQRVEGACLEIPAVEEETQHLLVVA